VWRALPGWRRSTSGARRWSELPREARDYLEWVEREVGVPIRTVSVGAARDAEVVRG
jgi:adenylosuccinate synthase